MKLCPVIGAPSIPKNDQTWRYAKYVSLVPREVWAQKLNFLIVLKVNDESNKEDHFRPLPRDARSADASAYAWHGEAQNFKQVHFGFCFLSFQLYNYFSDCLTILGSVHDGWYQVQRVSSGKQFPKWENFSHDWRRFMNQWWFMDFSLRVILPSGNLA